MSELSRRYAQALFETGPEEAALKSSAAVLMGASALWDALKSPVVRPEEKCRVLEAVLGAGHPLLPFYDLLARKGRMALLPDILSDFHGLVLAARNAAEGVMVCARAPEVEQLRRLEAALCRFQNRAEVRLTVREDPALLGGFRLELGGVTYDYSVKGRLDALGRTLQAR